MKRAFEILATLLAYLGVLAICSLPLVNDLRATSITTTGAGAPSAIAKAVSYGSESFQTTSASTYTFTSASYGASSPDCVVVGVGGGNSTRTISSMTIGGVSASLIKQQVSTNYTAEMWGATGVSGSSGNIVVNWSGSQANGTHIGVWSLTGTGGCTATATAGSTAIPGAPALASTSNPGVAIGYAYGNNNSATTSVTNATKRFGDNNATANNTAVGADTSTSGGALTITFTMTGGTPTTEASLAAAW